MRRKDSHIKPRADFRSCIVGFLLLPSVVALADQAPYQHIHEMNHTRWTMKEGAPGGISGLAQTPDGYLWLSTKNGLFRFDGKVFERVDPTRGDALAEDTISDVYAPLGGGLWLAYAKNHGASYFKSGLNTNFLEHSTFWSLARSGSGEMWAATEKGLMHLVGSKWEPAGLNSHYDDETSHDLWTDARGTLWVSGERGLAYLRSGASQFQRAGAATGDVANIASAAEGPIWISTQSPNEIRAVNATDGKLLGRPLSLARQVYDIAVARDGSLWAAAWGQGLLRIPNAKALLSESQPHADFETFGPADGLSGDRVISMLEDNEGSMWVATSKGLDQFRRNALTAVQLPEASHDSSFLGGVAIVADADGGLIAGKESNPLVRVAGGVAQIMSEHAPTDISCAYRDPTGTIWLGNTLGVWRYVGGVFQFIPFPLKLARSSTTQAMTLDRDSALWVALTGQGGTYKFQDGVWTKAAEMLPLSTRYVTVLHTDSSGKLWFGHMGNGIELLSGQSVAKLDDSQGLAVGNVLSIAERNGHLWVGGEKGIQRYENGRFATVTFANDLAVKSVSGVVETAEGQIWINSIVGVIRVDRVNIALWEHDHSHRLQYSLYNYLDGLQDLPTDIRPLGTATEATDGRIYFATTGGLYWIDPARNPTNPMIPTVMVSAISANGVSYGNPDHVALAPRSENVGFKYTATSLLIPDRVRFRYQLVGFDRGWIEAGARREAFYSKLPPGSFTLRVKASNNDGVWNETGASIRITVQPSFVQSWIFKTLCSVLALVFLTTLYLLRMRQVTIQLRDRVYARVSERERIARDLHDTFFQGIQGLLLSFHSATERMRTDDPVRPLFENALVKSDRVMAEGRELVLELRRDGRERSDFVTLIHEVGIELSRESSVDFKVLVNGEVRPLQPGVADEMFYLGREALSNSFRHSGARAIEAEINYEPKELRLRFRDNGRGIDHTILQEGQRANHWGLPGMRERARKVGARLDIWTGIHSGTEVEIRIPSSKAYLPPESSSRRRQLKGLMSRLRREHD